MGEKKATLIKNCGISTDISVRIVAVLLSGRKKEKSIHRFWQQK